MQLINRFQQPVLVKDLRRFLGMLNFYQRFIPQAASIQGPLHAALAFPKFKGSQPGDWTHTLVQAFEDSKAILSMPHFWLTRTLLLCWHYLQTLLILLLAPPCQGLPSAASAALGNPWLSTPISSAPLNKLQSVRPQACSEQGHQVFPMHGRRPSLCHLYRSQASRLCFPGMQR